MSEGLVFPVGDDGRPVDGPAVYRRDDVVEGDSTGVLPLHGHWVGDHSGCPAGASCRDEVQAMAPGPGVAGRESARALRLEVAMADSGSVAAHDEALGRDAVDPAEFGGVVRRWAAIRHAFGAAGDRGVVEWAWSLPGMGEPLRCRDEAEARRMALRYPGSVAHRRLVGPWQEVPDAES